MTTLNDITGRLQEENTNNILSSLQERLLKIQDNMDSDSGKFFLKELSDIIDKSDTKSQKGLNKLNNKLSNLNSSIDKSNSLNDSEKNIFKESISEQSEIVNNNTTLAAKIESIITNKKEEIANKGFNTDLSGAVMAVTGSPAFGLAAGFIQDKIQDRIKENVESEHERKEQESRIKQHEELKSKEFDFLRTQISEQDVKDKFNLTEDDILNKARENNTTYEEYLNTLKDSIIEQSSQNKKTNEQNDEIRQEEDNIRKKYGMNDNDNVTSNVYNEPTNNDNNNVTSNVYNEPTNNDNNNVSSIFPTSSTSTGVGQSIETIREQERQEEQQINEMEDTNEHLIDIKKLLAKGGIGSDTEEGGGIIDTLIDWVGLEKIGKYVAGALGIGTLGSLFGGGAAGAGGAAGGNALTTFMSSLSIPNITGPVAAGGRGLMSTIGGLATNPIGQAVLATAALGAGGYLLWDHMRGSEESKAALDLAEEAGAVEHNVFGESTVLKGGWEKIKKMKPEAIQALADYDDWDAEAKKGFDEILNPKAKNTKDYQEGKKEKEIAQQKLDTFNNENINSEKITKTRKDAFHDDENYQEYKDPEIQKEENKLNTDLDSADKKIESAIQNEVNRLTPGYTKPDFPDDPDDVEEADFENHMSKLRMLSRVGLVDYTPLAKDGDDKYSSEDVSEKSKSGLGGLWQWDRDREYTGENAHPKVVDNIMNILAEKSLNAGAENNIESRGEVTNTKSKQTLEESKGDLDKKTDTTKKTDTGDYQPLDTSRWLDWGNGDMSDLYTMDDGTSLSYNYYKGQRYKWTEEDILSKYKQYKQGEKVSIGMNAMPQDQNHLNEFSPYFKKLQDSGQLDRNIWKTKTPSNKFSRSNDNNITTQPPKTKISDNDEKQKDESTLLENAYDYTPVGMMTNMMGFTTSESDKEKQKDESTLLENAYDYTPVGMMTNMMGFTTSESDKEKQTVDPKISLQPQHEEGQPQYKEGEEWKEFRKPARSPGNSRSEQAADSKAKLQYKYELSKKSKTGGLIGNEPVGDELTDKQYSLLSTQKRMNNTDSTGIQLRPEHQQLMQQYEMSQSNKIKPYNNPNQSNTALRQNELNNEKSKYENKNKKESKDNIINAPTNNVNNSKQNITNVIDTSKNSFNSANKGLRGAF
jgi:hypothetical protein